MLDSEYVISENHCDIIYTIVLLFFSVWVLLMHGWVSEPYCIYM